MRYELVAAVMRETMRPRVTPNEVAKEIEHILRRSGIDEMRIAVSLGKFWGNYFKRVEALER